jgi:hypothetical protein
MSDPCDVLYRAVLDDRDRLLDVIREKDIRIAELERALAFRDQLITLGRERDEGI